MGKVILVPDYVDPAGPLIFLAGPIQGAPDWQSDAIRRIQFYDSDFSIASPRRKIELSPGERFSEDMYNKQMDWEKNYLIRAAKNGGILFWLAREQEHSCGRAYAQTSRFELGEWLVKHQRDGAKLAVGIEDGFTNYRYIKRRLKQDAPKIKVYDNLDNTCQGIVELVRGF